LVVGAIELHGLIYRVPPFDRDVMNRLVSRRRARERTDQLLLRGPFEPMTNGVECRRLRLESRSLDKLERCNGQPCQARTTGAIAQSRILSSAYRVKLIRLACD
jgi:hypothetical protein